MNRYTTLTGTTSSVPALSAVHLDVEAVTKLNIVRIDVTQHGAAVGTLAFGIYDSASFDPTGKVLGFRTQRAPLAFPKPATGGPQALDGFVPYDDADDSGMLHLEFVNRDRLHAHVYDYAITYEDATASGGGVPESRTINGHALSSNVTITSSDVGLGNCDNTADLTKPVSAATQDALDLKQDALGFTAVSTTRTVNGHALSGDVTVSKSDVSLGSVDNVQQLPLSYLDTDSTLAANSDAKVPSQKAAKAYADAVGSAAASYADTAAATALHAAWPIGSIFISVVATNPGTLLGFGTWSAFAAGRMLVGLDSGDTDFDTAEETGGSKTVTPTGTNSAPTFTGSALGTHSHGTGTLAVSAHSGTAVSAHAGTAVSSHAGAAVASHAAHTHSVTSNVAVDDHASHTHSVTSNVTVDDHASHTHSVTSNVTGTVTPAGTIAWPTGGNVPTFAGTPATIAATATASLKAGTSASTVADNTHTHAFTPAGTIAWPAGVPAFTGTASQTVSMTNNAVTSGNPSATLSHTMHNPAVTSAGPSATLTHTVTNNAVTSGNPSATLTHTVTQPNDHSVTQPDNHTVTEPADHTLSGSTAATSAGTPAGTVSAPTFTGDSQSTLPPYIVTYMWRRTA